MAALLPESTRKIFTGEALRSAAKQSTRCQVVPVRLRRAIKRYLREQEMTHVKRNVFMLSESFNKIKDANRLLAASTSKELVEDPLKSVEQSQRWKIKSLYGELGLTYREDETAAYVASRMPAVYTVCRRVLREVRRRVPEFAPTKVLDFGAGTGSGCWAVRDTWPKSLERINLVEPSQPMQRAGQALIQDLKMLPLIHSFSSIQALAQSIGKTGRKHDLVIASYVLGEIPSLRDRVTTVRQLWDLTSDILVLIEPGTPQGSSIISQTRSHILWMEKRKCRKNKDSLTESLQDKASPKSGAFIVAPCPHDGHCPLANTSKYCHFVQRLQRTSSQRTYKKIKGESLRGFEDEKFSFVVFRRGKRPQEKWPLDELKFKTLKEHQAARNTEDLGVVDYESENSVADEEEADDGIVQYERKNHSLIDSDADEEFTTEEEEEQDETGKADLGTGWGRIIFMPQKRGKRIEMDVCRSIKRDGSEGAFEHLVITKSKNPTLHHQAKRSIWGDLWPF